MTVKLFVADSCPHCPRAKIMMQELAKRLNFKLEVVNCSTEQGLKQAQDNDIYLVPTLLMDGKTSSVHSPEDAMRFLGVLE